MRPYHSKDGTAPWVDRFVAEVFFKLQNGPISDVLDLAWMCTSPIHHIMQIAVEKHVPYHENAFSGTQMEPTDWDSGSSHSLPLVKL